MHVKIAKNKQIIKEKSLFKKDLYPSQNLFVMKFCFWYVVLQVFFSSIIIFNNRHLNKIFYSTSKTLYILELSKLHLKQLILNMY